MTDREKLEEIRKMCEAAFSASFTSQDIDLGRAQALANVYGVILYDGATIANTSDAVRQYEEEHDNQQITFDDLLDDNNTFLEKLAKEIREMPLVNFSEERHPITISEIAQLKHKIDAALDLAALDHEGFRVFIEMSKADMYDVIGIFHDEVRISNEYTLMGLPVHFVPAHGIRLVAFCDIQGEEK